MYEIKMYVTYILLTVSIPLQFIIKCDKIDIFLIGSFQESVSKMKHLRCSSNA